MAEDINESGKKAESKLFLRPSSIFTIVFLTITAVALAYIAGVMSGRHLNVSHPEVASVSETEVKPEPEHKEAESILAPEELNFVRELREQAARINKNPALGESDSATETEKNSDETTTVAGKPEDSAPQTAAQLFDYLFQIAAFREENGADNLREKLEGAGYRTILQKNGKMLVILVRVRGTEANAQELRNLALSMRLGDPLLKHKQPVPQ